MLDHSMPTVSLLRDIRAETARDIEQRESELVSLRRRLDRIDALLDGSDFPLEVVSNRDRIRREFWRAAQTSSRWLSYDDLHRTLADLSRGEIRAQVHQLRTLGEIERTKDGDDRHTFVKMPERKFARRTLAT